MHSNHSCINLGFRLHLLPFYFIFYYSYNFNLKLCGKQYNKIDFLHLIVAPQLIGGWQHNYLTKTRQTYRVNEQSIYSLMSMVYAQVGQKFQNIQDLLIYSSSFLRQSFSQQCFSKNVSCYRSCSNKFCFHSLALIRFVIP